MKIIPTNAIYRSEKKHRYEKDFPNKSYLAAPFRYTLSATAETMIKQAFLDGSETHLDYGCGRGGDVERLQELGYKSTGYDPYYFPADKLEPVDVVTMGYVLNVIEDSVERREALTRAWSLTRKRLIIAANIRGRGNGCESISKIGTFRKFYSFVELKAYIESVLGFEAVRLDRDKFIVHRDGRQFNPLDYESVLSKIEAIAHSGWVAPNAIIKRYRSGSSKPGPDARFHYRLISSEKHLPGKKGELVQVIHLRGGLESEHGQWAIASLQRRNRILEAKFHCVEQSFLSEFQGRKNFDFLNTENVKIYS